MISQADLEQLVSAHLLEKEWPFTLAAQILYYVHLCKVGGKIITDDNVIDSCITENIAFLEKGLQDRQLQDVSSRRSSIPKEYVTSAAVGIIASTSPVISSALTMISPLAPLSLAAIPFLFKKKHNKQINLQQAVLVSAEVISYAKRHKKWLDSEEQATHLVTNSSKLNGIVTELLNKAENIIESARKDKCISGTLQAKNACGPRPKINYAKVQAAYYALLNIQKGCTCISTKLESPVYLEISQDLLEKYPEITKTALKGYVKEAVKLAMKTDDVAITRVYKLNGYWDNKWLKIKCKLPGHTS